MPQPTNGITPDIIRDAMPPYHLDPDLLRATVAALPPPPPNATQPQRHARLTRLLSEVAAYRPADPGQARLATQILTIRELADTFVARAHTAALEFNQLCRAARTTAELLRSANALERTLTLRQQKPVPFFGTVIQDEVDIAALDAQWIASEGTISERTISGVTHTAPPPGDAAAPPDAPPDAAPDAAPTQTAATTAPPITPQASPETPLQATTPPVPPHHPEMPATRPAAPPAAAARPVPAPLPTPAPTPATRPAAPGSDWTVTRLDSGPGWTREILRHRATIPAEAAE